MNNPDAIQPMYKGQQPKKKKPLKELPKKNRILEEIQQK